MCVGEGWGHNHMASSIAQCWKGVSEPVKEGDVGCAGEASTCSPLPLSRGVVVGRARPVVEGSSVIIAPSSEDSLRQWFSVPSICCQHWEAVRKYQCSDSRSNMVVSLGVVIGFQYFKNVAR